MLNKKLNNTSHLYSFLFLKYFSNTLLRLSLSACLGCFSHKTLKNNAGLEKWKIFKLKKNFNFRPKRLKLKVQFIKYYKMKVSCLFFKFLFYVWVKYSQNQHHQNKLNNTRLIFQKRSSHLMFYWTICFKRTLNKDGSNKTVWS